MRKIVTAVALVAIGVSTAGAAPHPATMASDSPVKIAVTVSPEPIAAGSDAAVTVTLDPKPGIKLNKYPKIKVHIAAVDGLVGLAEQTLGNPAPPPADQLDANYFHGAIAPLSLTLHLDPQAAKGRHDIQAKLSYFYCVAASGYCAPAKADLKIPVTIR